MFHIGRVARLARCSVAFTVALLSPDVSAQAIVTAGIETAQEVEARPYGFRVQWVAWNSGFRGTRLRPGDRIIGVDGKRYEHVEGGQEWRKAIGQHAEAASWRAQGIDAGHSIRLTVDRYGERFEVAGELVATHHYRDEKGNPTLGPAGPPMHTRDEEFRQPWGGWYRQRVDFAKKVLNRGWETSIDTRWLLGKHLAERARVDALRRDYAGPFVRTVVEDWQRVCASLSGRVRELTETDLAHREAATQRVARVAKAATSAHAAFVARHGADLIEPFPAVDPLSKDLDTVTGKLVRLSGIEKRHWVREGDNVYMCAGDPRRGIYFVHTRQPAVHRLFDAIDRYRASVAPNLRSTLDVIGRVAPEPRMVVVRDRAVTGFGIELIAATVGGAMFVDLSDGLAERSHFAGERELLAPRGPLPADDAEPAGVLRSYLEAIRWGDETTWRALIAPWRLRKVRGRRRIYYEPYFEHLDHRIARAWTSSRQLILGKVFAVEVVRAESPQIVLTADAFEGAPRIEECVVWIDHFGRFDGEYRTFRTSGSKRRWVLQRRDGGPWRVTSLQSL